MVRFVHPKPGTTAQKSVRPPEQTGNAVSSDREEAATGITPETLAVEMRTATERLREQGWKLSPLTSPVVVEDVERQQQSA